MHQPGMKMYGNPVKGDFSVMAGAVDLAVVKDREMASLHMMDRLLYVQIHVALQEEEDFIILVEMEPGISRAFRAFVHQDDGFI
ncbi:hypothetical protein HMPREF1548_04495 [Clostridium sp. KLE 1755]|nr:hypothetical protein HMPREF1548_04495 [Clostridium sp. KLE 1755]